MACHTCDHTMQLVGTIKHSEQRVFWCPRCGTIRTSCEDGERDAAPTLPLRVKKLAEHLGREENSKVSHTCEMLLRAFHTRGILEAAMLPDERPEL